MNETDTLYEKIKPLVSDPGKLFQQLHEVFVTEVREEITISGQVLARIQNEGHGCVFKMARDAFPKEGNFFSILHVLEKAIPFLDGIDVESLLEFEMVTYAELSRDFLGGKLRNTLIPWFEEHTYEAQQIMVHHANNPKEETGPIYRAAIIGLSGPRFEESFRFALASATKGDINLSGNSISVIGGFDWTLDERGKELEEALSFLTGIISNSEDQRYFAAAQAIQEIVVQRPEHYNLLLKVGRGGTREGLGAISFFLLRNDKQFQNEPWFLELLFLCTKIPVEDKGTLDNIDFVFYAQMKDVTMRETFRKWLTEWIGNQPAEVPFVDIPEVFDSTFNELIQYPDEIGKLFTEWLVHDDLRYPNSVNKLASGLMVRKVKSLSYDPVTISSMDELDHIHLIRRTLGWVVDASLRISLIWSLTKAADAPTKTYNEVYSVFSDFLGYDYPHVVREFLAPIREGAEEDNNLIELCDRIISEIDAYAANLDSLKRVKELRVLPEKFRQFNKARNKEQQSEMEEAQKGSIFLQIATQIPVKAGAGSFSRNPTGKGYTDRTVFASFKTSVALPRSDLINKISSEHQLLVFRHCKRGDQ